MNLNKGNTRVRKNNRLFFLEVKTGDKWSPLVLEGKPQIFASAERGCNRRAQLLGENICVGVRVAEKPAAVTKVKKPVVVKKKKPVVKKKVAPARPMFVFAGFGATR